MIALSLEEWRRARASAVEAPVGAVIDGPALTVRGRRWTRRVIKTHVIQPGEDIAGIVARYAGPHVAPGDVVFVGEKAVAISQARFVQEDRIRPRTLARLLSRFVHRSPYGFGLGRAATMEVALREAGTMRILAAAGISLLTRALGRRGDFYRVAGRSVASIDGATAWGLPPFNRCIVMSPRAPGRVAEAIAARIGTGVAVVDLNDVGSTVAGASRGVDPVLVAALLRDNPLGQGPFQTPLGILHPAAPVVRPVPGGPWRERRPGGGSDGLSGRRPAGGPARRPPAAPRTPTIPRLRAQWPPAER